MLRRRILAPAVIAAAALALAACGGSGGSSTSSAASPSGSATSQGPVTIAAFNFGESRILANLYADVLEKAGYAPTVKELTTREVVAPALQKNEVQVVPEYLGTLTEFLNKQVNGPDAAPKASGDAETTFTNLKALAGPLGITALPFSKAQDQNAFAVTKEFAEANNISTISQLAEWSKTNNLILGGPPECPTRPFCQPGLEKTYGMKVSEFLPLDAGGPLTKQAIAQGKVTVGLVFSSDGGVEALNLTVLEDDKKLQTADNILPAVNTAAVTPALEKALNGVSDVLTTADLVTMNKAVDVDRKDPKVVAEEYLKSKGLL